MKDKLILFVGASGSGKSTVAGKLKEKYEWNIIQSCTTRKPRFEGETGHIFVDLDWYFADKNSSEIIAETYFDNNYYWATEEQYKGKGTSIYIIDPKGVKDIYKNIKDAEILTIYFMCDRETRYRRMIKRKKQEFKDILDAEIRNKAWTNEFENISQRLKHDDEAFRIIKCDYCIDNNKSIDNTIDLIQIIIGVDTNESINDNSSCC